MDREQAAFFRKFGAEVRKLRLSKNMTLEDMQDHGFSAQHFQKIESGKKAVNFYTVLRIVRAFEISLAALAKNVE
ncbi:MAG: helix-turn-helix transcriptional regulator [Parcubacteria group bacterium]